MSGVENSVEIPNCDGARRAVTRSRLGLEGKPANTRVFNKCTEKVDCRFGCTGNTANDNGDPTLFPSGECSRIEASEQLP